MLSQDFSWNLDFCFCCHWTRWKYNVMRTKLMKQAVLSAHRAVAFSKKALQAGAAHSVKLQKLNKRFNQ